jgi:hypothetical protein
MPGVAFGSSKLLLKNNAYIANKLDIGRTANDKMQCLYCEEIGYGQNYRWKRHCPYWAYSDIGMKFRTNITPHKSNKK